jgi:hypothetical protein
MPNFAKAQIALPEGYVFAIYQSVWKRRKIAE